MKFSVIFDTHTALGFNKTYTLDFVPSPCWMDGKELRINLNPESPHYSDVKEGCRKLMDSVGLSIPLRATVVALVDGLGEEQDLQALLKDMKSCGVEVEVFRSGFEGLT